jgi:F0F1-type ATP synthase gamma subunit
MEHPIVRKRKQRKYNIPVIGHFADRSIRFNSILEAEHITGIAYTLIFEACIGKIYKARNVYWEFENGAHFIKYKAHFMRARRQIEEQNLRPVGHHSHAHNEEHTKIEEKASH